MHNGTISHRTVTLLVAGTLSAAGTSAHAQTTADTDARTEAPLTTDTVASRSSPYRLPKVNVTGQRPSPVQMSLDPRLKVQPARVSDGASLLKEIPNMGVVRKGQQGGDTVFRGLGGSRLAITTNDQFLYGGCGIRMDTPTTYINPEAYDELQVIKGPQTVLKGPGLVAGSVEFVRHPRTYDRPSFEVEGAVTAGSFNYYDGYADLSAGNPLVSLRTILTHSRSDDYKDGAGERVRSWYKRRSASVNLALTPTQDTRIELFGDATRSQAKFASLQLDAGKTDRDAFGARAEVRDISSLVRKISLDAGRSHQDIIMGRQFRGRQAGGNPDRITRNARFSGGLAWADGQLATIGMDWFDDQHRARRAYTDMPRSLSEKSNDLGFFIENTSRLSEGHSVVAGARHDRMHATAYQGFWNDEAHPRTRYELNAGFARYEYSHAGVQYQAGLGYTERGPDFWERNRNRAIQPERSLQLDVGAGWHTGDLHLHGTAFANRINDYILIEKDNPLLNDLAAESTARNVDAVRYGFELGAEYALAGNWKSSASLAYTWGRNQTESRPLGQIPPLEGRLRAGYDSEVFALMGTLRAATRQNRVAFGQGNVNGVDIGPTPGFAVFGIDGHWQFSRQLRVSFGVDNLFDRLYAEHLTKAVQTPEFYQALGVNPNSGSSTRINEPGRAAWVRLDLKW